MNISNNPAYAFLFGSAHPTKNESLIEQATGSPESFNERLADKLTNLLADEKGYVQSVFHGLDEFTPENREHALEDAARLSDCINRAAVQYEAVQYCQNEKRPFHEWNDAQLRLRIELVNMFYLHREIEVLRLFMPLARSRIESTKALENKRVAGTDGMKKKAATRDNAIQRLVEQEYRKTPGVKAKQFGRYANDFDVAESTLIKKAGNVLKVLRSK